MNLLKKAVYAQKKMLLPQSLLASFACHADKPLVSKHSWTVGGCIFTVPALPGQRIRVDKRTQAVKLVCQTLLLFYTQDRDPTQKK